MTPEQLITQNYYYALSTGSTVEEIGTLEDWLNDMSTVFEAEYLTANN